MHNQKKTKDAFADIITKIEIKYFDLSLDTKFILVAKRIRLYQSTFNSILVNKEMVFHEIAKMIFKVPTVNGSTFSNDCSCFMPSYER